VCACVCMHVCSCTSSVHTSRCVAAFLQQRNERCAHCVATHRDILDHILTLTNFGSNQLRTTEYGLLGSLLASVHNADEAPAVYPSFKEDAGKWGLQILAGHCVHIFAVRATRAECAVTSFCTVSDDLVFVLTFWLSFLYVQALGLV